MNTVTISCMLLVTLNRLLAHMLPVELFFLTASLLCLLLYTSHQWGVHYEGGIHYQIKMLFTNTNNNNEQETEIDEDNSRFRSRFADKKAMKQDMKEECRESHCWAVIIH